MAKPSEIEGLGEAYSAKLEAAGITSLENLLTTCCEKKAARK